MKSNNKTLQGLKKVNDRLLGIETFLLALITILAGRGHLHRGGLPVFPVYLCRVGGRVHPLSLHLADLHRLSLRYLRQQPHRDRCAQAGAYEDQGPSPRKVAQGAGRSRAIISTFAFLVVFAKLFFDYMMKIFGTTQTSPTMRIPMGWVYLPVFVGIVLAALHEVYMLAACLLGGDKKSAAEADN